MGGILPFTQAPQAFVIKSMIIKEISLLPGLSITLPGLALRQDSSGNRQDFAAALAVSLGKNGSDSEAVLPQALQTAGLVAAPGLPEEAARLLQVADPEDEGRPLLPIDEPVIAAADLGQSATGNTLAAMIEPDAVLKQSSFDSDRLRQGAGAPVETASPKRDRLAPSAGSQQDLARYPSNAVTGMPASVTNGPPVLAPTAEPVLVMDELGTTSRIPVNSDKSGSSDPGVRNKAESAPSSNQWLQRQQAGTTQDAASASWSGTSRADFVASGVPPLLPQATSFPPERAGLPQRFRGIDHTTASSSSMTAVSEPDATEPAVSPALTATAGESGNLLFRTALARQSQLPVGQEYVATIASAMPLAEESDALATGGMSLEERLVTETAFLSGKTATEGWLKEIGLNVTGMVQGKLGRMSLQLHPAELGALEIEILTNDGTASFDFVATQAGTRELLESSLPRLRELLQQQGMLLGDAVVREQSQQHHARDQQQSSPVRPAMPGEEPVTDTPNIRQPRIDRTALIDAYA